MKKTFLLILLLFITISLSAQNYGAYKQYATIDFEDGTVDDQLGNAGCLLQNGASIVNDPERGGKVVQFTASQKGNIKFSSSPLNDSLTIAFWYKREAEDPAENWRMMFAFYAADGSNVYFTPKTSWGENAYLVYNSIPYSMYKTAIGSPVINNKWTHYAIIFAGNLMKIYQNGELMSSTSMLTKLSDINSTKWFLGCNPELNYPMTGKMDDIKIFHSSLADNQIKAIFENKTIASAIDAVRPFVNLPLDIDSKDSEGNISTTSSNLSFQIDTEKGKVGLLSPNGRIAFNTNPFGTFKYSMALMLKKESYVSDNSKYIYKATAANGDFFGLRIKYADSKTLIDLVSNQNNTLTVLGTSSTTNALQADKWNSLVLVQTYSSVGTPAIRLYINGISAFIKTNINLNTYNFNGWFIGSDDNENLSAKFDEIKIFQREITSTEVTNYNNSQIITLDIKANLENQHQTIRNFGASDGWNTQFVGLYFNESQKERLAELLFSKEKNNDGTPKGIGLSSWRFNIGAGTSEQGTASRISTPERRSECFLNSDGTYNWNKQAGQRWFLEKAAKTYHVPDLIGWQNSPPVRYTVRGLGFREYGDTKKSILKTEHYSDFGKYLADVILHFKSQGVNINYISPLNEPQWDWMPDAAGAEVKQEGSPWTNQEISNVVKSIGAEFITKNVDTKLFVGEAGAINCLLSGTGVAYNQLAQLWDNSSSIYLGNSSALSNIVSSHSYGDDKSAGGLINTRQSLKDRMKLLNPDLEFWQTEYCLLGTGYQFGQPTGRTLTPMECAISLARVIHADLAIANATGWQWWTTFEFEKNLSTEDRFALIRVALNTSNTAGIYKPTKLLYALGNFSHFIRPGAKRLEISRSDNMNDVDAVTNLMVSAYLNETANEVVYVVINPGTSEKGIKLLVENLLPNTSISEFTPFITTDREGDNVKKYPAFSANERYIIPPTSVVTFVGTINQETGTQVDNYQSYFSIYPNPATTTIRIISNDSQANSILKITDISGKLLFIESLDQSDTSFDTSSLNRGLYFITIENALGSQTQKLMITK